MPVTSLGFDAVVIGGGIVGTAILRELARAGLRPVLVEREPDLCEGTSKSNSGIVHTGFDARPGTVEARLLAESRELWPEMIRRLRIPYLPCGAVMVALDREQMDVITTRIMPDAAANGVPAELITAAAVRERIPAVAESAAGGLAVPGEGVIDPFLATRAFAEVAAQNGARVLLGHRAVGLAPAGEGLAVQTSAGLALRADWVINAAGLWADEVARLAGDDSFTLTPRRGQFILVEEDLGVAHIVLPVPTPISKGVLVTPVVLGGLLLGPTAEDITGKLDRSTTAAGLARVRAATAALVPAVGEVPSVRQFAGVRAVSSTGDYIIRPSAVHPRLVHVAGIRSTGVSAAPGIAREVMRVLGGLGVGLAERPDFRDDRTEILSGAQAATDTRVICLCRSITRGEILGQMGGQVPPATLDALKRRTGATLGLCQGNLCTPLLLELLSRRSGLPPAAVQKHVEGSYVAHARTGPDEPVSGQAEGGDGGGAQ